MQVLADDVVNVLSRLSQPARDLLLFDVVGQERERNRVVVAGLNLGLRVVDRATVEPRRSSCLKPFQREAEFAERTRKTA